MNSVKRRYITLNGLKTEFSDEKNLLAIIRHNNIELPTFCYYSELSIYGACRMCMVEDDRGDIMAACSTQPRDGMVIYTNTPRLHKYRKNILELMLSVHCRDCTTCEKSGDCRLQSLAKRFGITSVRFDGGKPFPKTHPVDDSSLSVVRDPSKCILCGDCVRMCSEIQNVGAIDFAYRGSKTYVTPAFGRPLAESNCVNCGQCAAVCPTGAIVVKNDADRIWEAIHDPSKRVVAQIAPAVRVALDDEPGFSGGPTAIAKIATALRKIGFDRVYDTSLGADLTIMEEAQELVERLSHGQHTMPLFTSCCPAWIRYAEQNHPELLPDISTCRSPMQMFGSVIKEHYEEYYHGEEKKDPRELFVVAVMPCTAKKYEAAREEFQKEGTPYIDAVITTQEMIRMIRESGVQFNELEPEALDMPFGIYSGGGVIFGVSGGVTEAAVRSLLDKNPTVQREIEFCGVRGLEGMKEAVVNVGGRDVRIAVVNGLANAEKVIASIQAGETQYDFVEVMACPGGCIGGAGQPLAGGRMRKKRSENLYKADKQTQFKRSNENPMMETLYQGVLKNRVKELLHVHYGTHHE